ncbi:MAG TPA: FAD-dependent thymidylate synthase [bacterium]|nr:FAD-dependent thymidylate synthase [bacterium]
MKIVLAGFNVDVETLKELNGGKLNHETMTPETISAAYARISRSPKPVDELRGLARNEVEKSRKSNKNIIFAMGHHSVAEHAVFNFDVIDVSRLAIEELEKFRLCSFTEKSQRYITLEGGFVVPEEIKHSPHHGAFVALAKELNGSYHRFFEKLKGYVWASNAALAADPKNHSLLEGWAKEDARYITPLANTGQLGQTINARNLELLMRRFASHPLKEVQQLGRSYYELVEKISPSIILFSQANDLDQKTYDGLRDLAKKTTVPSPAREGSAVRLCAYTADPDVSAVAALMHAATGNAYEQCRAAAARMSEAQKREWIKTACVHMELYDATVREFEHVTFTFELTVSAACYGQLKRHRMSTQTMQPYDPALGLTIPAAIAATGLDTEFRAMADKAAVLFGEIAREMPHAAPYCLTNAHRRRVLMTVNARELYHISRLREDAHAQWDIRELSALMAAEARAVAPLTMMLICGKDRYAETYRGVYGRLPKVAPAVLPGH